MVTWVVNLGGDFVTWVMSWSDDDLGGGLEGDLGGELGLGGMMWVQVADDLVVGDLELGVGDFELVAGDLELVVGDLELVVGDLELVVGLELVHW